MSISIDKDMADIFVSYAREDQEKAKRLAQALADHGWSVWWDRRIPTGRRFHDVIERELTAARCVIALWSKAALASSWVWEEAQDGLDRDILVPARIETVRLPLGFRAIQTVDLSDWAGDPAHPGFAQLVEDITVALGEVSSREQVLELEAKPAQKAAEPNVKKASDLRDLPDLAVFRDIDVPWCPEMVVLPAGTFLMGSLEDEEGRSSDEGPQHSVTIGYRFAIGSYPVTFEQYDYFCAVTTRERPGDAGWGRGRRPVIHVSWEDAQAYVRWLAETTGQPYRLPYRLPSEAEWEYACRAGTTTRYSFGNGITPKDANYDIKVGKTTEIGAYPPNAWGLYDMHGNVWEWCADGRRGYGASPVIDPVGPTEPGAARVLRGGCWLNYAQAVRSASRDAKLPGNRGNYIGFRCVRIQS